MTVDFKALPRPGNFFQSFRLVHGENKIEFGDKASIDIEIKALPEVEAVEAPLLSFDNVFEQPAMVPAEEPVKEEKSSLEEEEEKVSDKEIAMMRSQQMLEKFE